MVGYKSLFAIAMLVGFTLVLPGCGGDGSSGSGGSTDGGGGGYPGGGGISGGGSDGASGCDADNVACKGLFKLLEIQISKTGSSDLTNLGTPTMLRLYLFDDGSFWMEMQGNSGGSLLTYTAGFGKGVQSGNTYTANAIVTPWLAKSGIGASKSTSFELDFKNAKGTLKVGGVSMNLGVWNDMSFTRTAANLSKARLKGGTYQGDSYGVLNGSSLSFEFRSVERFAGSFLLPDGTCNISGTLVSDKTRQVVPTTLTMGSGCGKEKGVSFTGFGFFIDDGNAVRFEVFGTDATQRFQHISGDKH